MKVVGAMLYGVLAMADIPAALHEAQPSTEMFEVSTVTDEVTTVAIEEEVSTVSEDTTPISDEVSALDLSASDIAPRGIFDGIGNLWGDATDIFDATKCKQYASASECCSSCSVCRGGTILKLLYDYNKIPEAIKSLLSNEQLATGDLCGVPKDKCTAFTSYFEAIPDSIIKMLSYIHVTVPKYYDEGNCPTDSAAALVGGASALTALAAISLF